MASILVMNGPNLNLLGKREPGIYGSSTLSDINDHLSTLAKDHHLEYFQSNAEHELINRIHAAYEEQVDFVIINPGAFTHTSIALRDAFLATKLPFIEVHLSNIHAREPFRKHSYLSDISNGVICGFGAVGYEMALTAALFKLKQN